MEPAWKDINRFFIFLCNVFSQSHTVSVCYSQSRGSMKLAFVRGGNELDVLLI